MVTEHPQVNRWMFRGCFNLLICWRGDKTVREFRGFYDRNTAWPHFHIEVVFIVFRIKPTFIVFHVELVFIVLARSMCLLVGKGVASLLSTSEGDDMGERFSSSAPQPSWARSPCSTTTSPRILLKVCRRSIGRGGVPLPPPLVRPLPVGLYTVVMPL